MSSSIVAAIGFFLTVGAAGAPGDPQPLPSSQLPELVTVFRGKHVEVRWEDRGELYLATAKSAEVVDGTFILTGTSESLATVRGEINHTGMSGLQIRYSLATGECAIKGTPDKKNAVDASSAAPDRIGRLILVGNIRTTDQAILEELPALKPGYPLPCEADLLRAEIRLLMKYHKRFDLDAGKRPTIKVLPREDSAFRDIRVSFPECGK